MSGASRFRFERFVKYYTITREDIINHLLEVFHPDVKGKQRLGIQYDLNLIIDATFKLSEQMGFPRMTVRDLQKESGVSMGSIYKCIVSKQVLEDMIVEGMAFFSINSTLVLEWEEADDLKLKRVLKGYIFVSELFRPWYYFVYSELRTMAEHNTRRIQTLRKDYVEALASLLNGHKLYASHVALIIQDRYLKKWKYNDVDIDDFADHCLALAHLLKDNEAVLGTLPVDYDSDQAKSLPSQSHNP